MNQETYEHFKLSRYFTKIALSNTVYPTQRYSYYCDIKIKERDLFDLKNLN